MREKGLRVLVFSQMNRVLDILVFLFFFRRFLLSRALEIVVDTPLVEHFWIYVGTAHDDPIAANTYNRLPVGSKKFIFLGINLTSRMI